MMEDLSRVRVMKALASTRAGRSSPRRKRRRPLHLTNAAGLGVLCLFASGFEAMGQQEVVDTPSASPPENIAPVSLTMQDMFRPSVNQNPQPAGGPTVPTPQLGGIFLPSESTPTTIPPTANPIVIPSPVPTSMPIPAPTAPTTVPTLSPTEPLQEPTTQQTVFGGAISPRPTSNNIAPTPQYSGSATSRPTQGLAISPECKMNVEWADVNLDGILDEGEYVTLVNVIASVNIASSFSGLPSALQDKFNDWTSQGQVPLDVSALLRSDNIFRPTRTAALETICTDITSLVAGLSSGSQPTPPPIVSSSPAPSPQLPTPLPFAATPSVSPGVVPTAPTAQQFDVSACLDAVSFSDWDGDGGFNEAEFVAFVNVLGDKLIAASFSDLTTALQDVYTSLTTDDTIHFADPNDAAVLQFCQNAQSAIPSVPDRISDLTSLADALIGGTAANSSFAQSTAPSQAPSTEQVILVLYSQDDADDESDPRDNEKNIGLIVGLTAGLTAFLILLLGLGYVVHQNMLRKHVYATVAASTNISPRTDNKPQLSLL